MNSNTALQVIIQLKSKMQIRAMIHMDPIDLLRAKLFLKPMDGMRNQQQ